MIIDSIVRQLQTRLQVTDIRIKATEDSGRMGGISLYDAGGLSALRSERNFLVDLIIQLEQTEVETQ